jgi:hypothetical protein
MLKERVPLRWRGGLFFVGWALLLAFSTVAVIEHLWVAAGIGFGLFGYSFVATLIKVVRFWRFAKRNANPS